MSEWKKIKLEEVVEIGSSKRIFYKDYVPFGIPFYRSKEIIEKKEGKKINDCLYITQDRYFDIKNKHGSPVEGDLLLSAVGHRSGIPYVVKDEGDFYFKDGNLIWFRNFSSELNSTFFYYWINSGLGQATLEGAMIGSAQKALTISGLKNLEINTPSPTEQKTIAEVLSSLDDKIDLLNRQNKTLEQMAETLFRQWFVEKAKGDCEYVKIGDNMEVLLGGTPSTKNEDYWDGDIPWINSGEINKDRILHPTKMITELGLNNSSTKLLPKGTTVIAITGATLGQVSRLEIEACANQSVIGILPNNEFSNEFIFLWIKYSIKKIISNQTGGAQQHINSIDIKNTKILKPDESIYKLFMEIVLPKFQKITNNVLQIEKLETLRNTLLPKLMSGKIKLKM